MEKDKSENPKPIYIKDYSITFYGGKTGLGENNRVVIALYAEPPISNSKKEKIN